MSSGSGRCIAGRHPKFGWWDISIREKNGYKKQNPSQEKLQNGEYIHEKAFYLVPQCASVFFICLKFSRIFWENVLAFFYSLSPFFAAMVVGGRKKHTTVSKRDNNAPSIFCVLGIPKQRKLISKPLKTPKSRNKSNGETQKIGWVWSYLSVSSVSRGAATTRGKN